MTHPANMAAGALLLAAGIRRVNASGDLAVNIARIVSYHFIPMGP